MGEAHSFAEAGGSAWLPTKVLLVARLAGVCWLLGETLFFSLRGDYDYLEYPVWANTLLAAAMLLLCVSSLCSVVSDDSDADSFGARALARVSVLMFQTAASAVWHAAVIHWAIVFPKEKSVSYSLLALHAVNPAIVAAEVLLSMRMRFAFVYVLFFWLFAAVHYAFFWAWYELGDKVIYQFIDHASIPIRTLIVRYAVIAAAAVGIPLVLVLVSCARRISLGVSHSKKKDPSEKSDAEAASASTSSNNSDPEVQEQGTESTGPSLVLPTLNPSALSPPPSAPPAPEDDEGLREVHVACGADKPRPLFKTTRASFRKHAEDRPAAGLASFSRVESDVTGDGFGFGTPDNLANAHASYSSQGSGSVTPHALFRRALSGRSSNASQENLLGNRNSSTKSWWSDVQEVAVQVDDEVFKMPQATAPDGANPDVIPLPPRQLSLSKKPSRLSTPWFQQTSSQKSLRFGHDGPTSPQV